jgi:hypothetical protein
MKYMEISFSNIKKIEIGSYTQGVTLKKSPDVNTTVKITGPISELVKVLNNNGKLTFEFDDEALLDYVKSNNLTKTDPSSNTSQYSNLQFGNGNNISFVSGNGQDTYTLNGDFYYKGYNLGKLPEIEVCTTDSIDIETASKTLVEGVILINCFTSSGVTNKRLNDAIVKYLIASGTGNVEAGIVNKIDKSGTGAVSTSDTNIVNSSGTGNVKIDNSNNPSINVSGTGSISITHATGQTAKYTTSGTSDILVKSSDIPEDANTINTNGVGSVTINGIKTDRFSNGKPKTTDKWSF